MKSVVTQEAISDAMAPPSARADSAERGRRPALPSWWPALSDAADEPSEAGQQRTGHSSLLDRAYLEYCERRERGEALDADAFCEQFPDLQNSLGRLIQAHRFLEKNPALLGAGWPEAGQTFLDFELHRELGRGAFARVFLATQPALGHRQVAVKISRGGGSEANTLGRIDHANVVPIFSVQEDVVTGLTAVCMPYLGSATLCHLLDRIQAQPVLPRSAQPIREVLESAAARKEKRAQLQGSYVDAVAAIAADLAAALQFIHDRNICHRDLKPSNVLLTGGGRAMLLDFNLCDDPQAVDTRVGGTLPYMPPEQLLATDGQMMAATAGLDARSDLFSLGVMLYELLSGRHPFGPLPLEQTPGETRQLLLQRQQAGAAPLRRFNRDVDPTLARLVERCLAYDPKSRPQHAAELVSALQKRQSAVERGRRWVGRHPWLAAVAALVLVFTTSAVAAFWPTPEPEDMRLWRLGQEAYRAGKYEQAVDWFNKLDAREPAQGKVLAARARAYQQWGETDDAKYSQAASDFFKANQLQPDPRLLACRGYCELRMKQPQAAGLDLLAVTGFVSAEHLNNVGYYWIGQAKTREAIDALTQAIERDGHLVPAYHNRAMAYLHIVQSSGGLPNPLNAPPPTKKSFDKAKEKAAKAVEVLCKAKSDMTVALDLAKDAATAELYRDAARIWTGSSEYDPRDRELAVAYFASALKRGMTWDGKSTTGFEPILNDWGLQQCIQEAANNQLRRGIAAVPAPTRRIVDPIHD